MVKDHRGMPLTRTTLDCANDLGQIISAYPDIFPAKPFDETFAVRLAVMVTGGVPGDATTLRLHTRTALWICAVDWLIDHEATSSSQVTDIVDRCIDTATGQNPPSHGGLARLLTELRSELSASPAFLDYESVWRDELTRMLTAMAREWHWNAERNTSTPAPLPTLDQYLDNADNLGSTWANVTHWIANGEPETLESLDQLRCLSRSTQQVIRLLNDLATIKRDQTWNDLNAMMLGADRATLNHTIRTLTKTFQVQSEPLIPRCPHGVDFLRRQLEWGLDYYGRNADVWGPES